MLIKGVFLNRKQVRAATREFMRRQNNALNHPDKATALAKMFVLQDIYTFVSQLDQELWASMSLEAQKIRKKYPDSYPSRHGIGSIL